jgi:hypothetical protein
MVDEAEGAGVIPRAQEAIEGPRISRIRVGLAARPGDPAADERP